MNPWNKKMNLRKIEVANFGPFYDTHVWDTEIEDGKPLILVRAFNDVAKSTILKLFNFCLYGLTPAKHQRVINRKAALKEDGETFVTFSFEHEGDDWQIKRTLKFQKVPEYNDPPNIKKHSYSITQNGSVIIDPQGEPSIGYDNDFKDKINEMIPKEISQFFFFDGEHIQNYVTEKPKPSITESIEKILGIKQFLNARKDLERVKRDFDAELLDAQGADTETQTIANELAVKRKQLDQDKAELESDGESIENQKNTLSDLKGFLTAQEGLKEDWVKRNQIEGALLTLNHRKEQNTLQRQKHHDVKLLSELLLIHLKPTTNPTQTYSTEQVTMAGQSIRDQKCSHCGEPLTDTAVGHLSEVANTHTSDKEFDMAQLISQISARPELAGAEAVHQTLLETATQLDGEISQGENAFDEIKNSLRESSQTLLAEVQEKQKKYDDLHIDNEVKKAEFARNTETYDSNEREYSNDVSANSARATTFQVIKAQAIVNICQKTLDGYIEIINSLVNSERENIEKEMSKSFMALTNNPELYDGLVLDKEYRILIKQMGFKPKPAWEIAPSSGQSAIIAFSFIIALNHKALRSAPVVVDTPTGRLDPVHTDNIIKFWQNFGNQVFILYQPNEINAKQLSSIQHLISHHYTAKRKPTNPDESYISKWDGVPE